MPKHFCDFRHLFFLHLKKRWKLAPWRETSPTPLVIYVFTSHLALVTRLTILRHHSGVRASEVYGSLADFDRLTVPPVTLLCDWSSKDLKKSPFPFLVTGNWTLNSLLWNRFQCHTFNVCCRTRCSVHDTTHLPSRVTKPVQCQQVVHSTCFARL